MTMGPQNIELFFTEFKPLVYRRGETLIRAEDEPSGVYFLKSGFVKMNSIFSNGSELTLNIFKPGSFFPMIWAIGEVPNTYFFQAITNIKVYKAPKTKLLEFIKNNPEVLLDLTKRLLIGMDGLLVNVQHILYGSSYNRVASAILILAKRFGETISEGQIIINVKFTHQDIAHLAGITRETASLAIAKLNKKGVIEQTHRRFLITNMQDLITETMFGDDLVMPASAL